MQMTPAILIVDDSAANRRLYQAVLSDLGADLYLAGTGEEALARFAERTYAMVLLDVHLSGMSGFEVAQALRDTHDTIDTPIVFVSALYVHQKDTYQGYQLGAVDYILSPVIPEIVRAKASVFIRLYRMRREAEVQAAAVEKVYRELRVAHADMEGFSYSVSHDLRTPLGQILGFADLMDMGTAGELSDKARQYVGYIQTAAHRMNDLINDMLVLANMTRSDMQQKWVDLSTLVQDIGAELAAAQPHRTVQLKVQSYLQAHGDERLLRVALSNLLGNAWKYSAIAEAPEVRFGKAREDDGAPVFFVSDNGAGFDVEAAGERLFRPFQRFHADSAFHGSGVGLAIVQRVVNKHGGRLWAESRPGEGASFFFTLPPPAAPAPA